MSNVVQLRSDDFLMHVRELGNITKAREAVKMDAATYQALMENHKYATTVMECLKECAEEAIIKMQHHKLEMVKGIYEKTSAQINLDTARLVQEVRDAGRS